MEVPKPKLTTDQGTGWYTLAFAVCNSSGRKVEINGNCMWKSKNGYLPGELYHDFLFTILLTIVYFSLMAWYASSMKKHSEAAIGIQPWILVTIFLGLVVMLFKSVDFIVWNVKGSRTSTIVYICTLFDLSSLL